MTEPNSKELLEGLAEDESAASIAIFERYVARLVALARVRIGPQLQPRIDPEDIVQSAYRSFFFHAKNEEYVWRRAGDLWRLLASITLHKLYGQVEWHTAARRDIAKEASVEVVRNDSIAEPTSREPTPDEALAFAEHLEKAMATLNESDRTVLIARLQGQTIEAIAAD